MKMLITIHSHSKPWEGTRARTGDWKVHGPHHAEGLQINKEVINKPTDTTNEKLNKLEVEKQ